MQYEKLKKQIAFIIEIDKLKHVFRQTFLMDASRRENDAEHSWHLAVMAILLSEYAEDEHLDVLRVVKMVLIHDIVEIDAGDTYCYDEAGAKDKAEREQKAADRLFNMLPLEQAEEFRILWEEFEACATPEARFAASLDRFQPLLHNYETKGQSWKEHRITSSQVLERNKPIQNGAPLLWQYTEELIADAIDKGYLKR